MGSAANGYPANPVVVRVHRAGEVESVHRGAWALVDVDGRSIASAGDVEHAYFARSSIKALQAFPLFESGAAEAAGFREPEVALALASHGGEPCHTEVVAGTLARLGLGPDHLRCGVHAPFESRARAELLARRESPTVLHNNCSGKHAAFLALARHLGDPLERYLDPESRSQTRVRAAVAELAGVPSRDLVPGIDGCSAPTYRLPLRALARAFARLANPEGLSGERGAIARRLTRAAAAHPILIGGSRQFLDTDLLVAGGGRIFPKIGAEAVHGLGIAGSGRGLAVKIDDGGARALSALVIGLLEALGLARPEELQRLSAWRDAKLENFAGLEVGHTTVVVPVPARA
jgi:L-asparaginase II